MSEEAMPNGRTRKIKAFQNKTIAADAVLFSALRPTYPPVGLPPTATIHPPVPSATG
jgi:hypothetical protein